MRLSLDARLQVEEALLRYRASRAALLGYRELEEDCTAAPAARWSHVGAISGQPGRPTQGRAIRLVRYREEHGDLDRARREVAAIDRWLGDMHRDDRLLVALVYGLEREERSSLHEACAALGIPHDDRDERRWVGEHVRDLLLALARGLGIEPSARVRRGGWEVGAAILAVDAS